MMFLDPRLRKVKHNFSYVSDLCCRWPIRITYIDFCLVILNLDSCMYEHIKPVCSNDLIYPIKKKREEKKIKKKSLCVAIEML